MIALIAGSAAIPEAHAQRIIRVDARATGESSGISWTDAFTDLGAALQTAQERDEIWVAAGVYKPVVPANPPDVSDPEHNATFRVENGIAVFGGFNGSELIREDRDFENNITILSGDLLGNDNDLIDVNEPTRSDNTWRIVKMGDIDLGPVDATTVLDGFTITGGNANPPALNPNNAGAGLNILGAQNEFSTPTIRNIRFEANSAIFGGGLGCVFAAPILENVDFINNSAAKDGGGMSTFVCGPELRNVRFRGNVAGDFGGGLINNRGRSLLFEVSFIGNTAGYGGGIYNLDSPSFFSNTFFASNEAMESGGGMHNENSRVDIVNTIFSGNRVVGPSIRGGGGMYNHLEVPYLTNVVFYGNTASNDGGAIFNNTSDPIIVNSILWGNSSPGPNQEIANAGTQGSTPLIGASIIEGGLPPGSDNAGLNLDSDPFFMDPGGADNIPGTLDDDFRVFPGSPAIDAGNNAWLLGDLMDVDEDGDFEETGPMDFARNVRIHNGGGGGFTVDIGAYEFGAPPVAVTIEEKDFADLPVIPVFVDAYPNPFTEYVTLRYELPLAGRVVLKVYDMLGREIVTIMDNILPAGIHTARFSAPDLASGMYIFRLDMAGTIVTKKMMRIE